MSKEKNLEELECQETEATECVAKEPVDYEKLVPWIIPVDNSPKRSKTIRLSLNGNSIVVPRGEMVEIPLKYKLMLERKEKLRQMDQSFQEEIQREMEPNNKQ